MEEHIVREQHPGLSEEKYSLPEGGASELINSVIESDLPENVKTRVIADSLIGASVRVMGADQAPEILEDIGKNIGISLEGDNWQKVFTRTDGLRRAIVDTDDSAQGKVALSKLEQRINRDDNGKFVLSSLDQVHAYIFAKTEAENTLKGRIEAASPWKQKLYQEVSDFLTIAGRSPAWSTPDNTGSEVAGVRQQQTEWNNASKIAVGVGIDVDLIAKSAQYMQEVGHDVGEAVLHDIPQDSIDQLF